MSSQDILVVAETNRGQVADISREMLGAARQLAAGTGGKVLAVLLSADGAAYAEALSAADRILLINDPLVGRILAETLPGRAGKRGEDGEPAGGAAGQHVDRAGRRPAAGRETQCPGDQRLPERFGGGRDVEGDGQLLRRETAGRRGRHCRAGHSLGGAREPFSPPRARARPKWRRSRARCLWTCRRGRVRGNDPARRHGRGHHPARRAGGRGPRHSTRGQPRGGRGTGQGPGRRGGGLAARSSTRVGCPPRGRWASRE